MVYKASDVTGITAPGKGGGRDTRRELAEVEAIAFGPPGNLGNADDGIRKRRTS
jgi:hypothetical protein